MSEQWKGERKHSMMLMCNQACRGTGKCLLTVDAQWPGVVRGVSIVSFCSCGMEARGTDTEQLQLTPFAHPRARFVTAPTK